MVFARSSHPLSPILADERQLLGELRELMARRGTPPEQLATLRQALADLDFLFLLVIAGEFNAGKSALINALLGERVLAEGVTPTTAAITLLSYGESAGCVDRTDGLLEIRHPLPMLRDLALVDTPGTNAVLRQHEQLTREFLPRADLLLFITSADRPFTESERAFLEQVREWGKKIVVVLNKVDLLSARAELEAQVLFVREGAQRLLGLDPPILPVSARLAQAAQVEHDSERSAALLRASGIMELRGFLQASLDEGGRSRLKLLSVLGVGERLVGEQRRALDVRLAVLHEDQATASRLEEHFAQHTQEQRREFELRLDRLDKLFLELAERGHRFFESNIRLARIFDLFNTDKMRADFECEVVADVPQRVDDLAQSIVEWMIDQDQRLWHQVSREIQRRAQAAPQVAASALELPFAEDRRAVLQTVTRTAREVVRRHDHHREADELATSVRDTITTTTLVEASALGLGAITMAVVGSAAADVTGLLAAGALAGVGLYLLPLKRRRAEHQFRERTETLRESLATALRREFNTNLETSLKRVRAALAPYDSFVATELERLEADSVALDGINDGLRGLRQRIEQTPLEPALPHQEPARLAASAVPDRL